MRAVTPLSRRGQRVGTPPAKGLTIQGLMDPEETSLSLEGAGVQAASGRQFKSKKFGCHAMEGVRRNVKKTAESACRS